MEGRKTVKKKMTIAALILLLGAVLLTGCGARAERKVEGQRESGEGAGQEASAEYQKITPEAARERMDSGDDIVVLDVRTLEEYEDKHIPGAILIPNEEIGDDTVLEELPELDQEILIYCRSGNRSAQAARKLLKAGYTNIYDFGGINDWPYETEGGT